jgi:uncharacterized membrane protein YkvA (DUF1232 family)
MQLTTSQYLLFALVIVIVVYALFAGVLLLVGRKYRALTWIGLIPNCIILFKRLLSDPEVPRIYKVTLLIMLAYLVSPIDIIPDFIPIVGQLDGPYCSNCVGIKIRFWINNKQLNAYQKPERYQSVQTVHTNNEYFYEPKK